MRRRGEGKPYRIKGVKQRRTGKQGGWRGTPAERWDEECETETKLDNAVSH